MTETSLHSLILASSLQDTKVPRMRAERNIFFIIKFLIVESYSELRYYSRYCEKLVTNETFDIENENEKLILSDAIRFLFDVV